MKIVCINGNNKRTAICVVFSSTFAPCEHISFFFKYHLQSLQQQQQQQRQATEILQKTEIIRGRKGEGARRERERGDRSIESYVENSNNKNGLCRRRRRQRSWLPLGVEQKCKSIEVKFGDGV